MPFPFPDQHLARTQTKYLISYCLRPTPPTMWRRHEVKKDWSCWWNLLSIFYSNITARKKHAQQLQLGISVEMAALTTFVKTTGKIKRRRVRSSLLQPSAKARLPRYTNCSTRFGILPINANKKNAPTSQTEVLKKRLYKIRRKYII